jgi:tetratricopeptide (TPR) repeat protein
LTWGEQAKAISPQKAAVYGVIGDAQLELGHYDDAFTTFQTMVDLRPDSTSYSRASYARELQGDLPAALQIMGMAAEAASTEGEQGAWTRVQHGDLLLKNGNLAEAEQEYNWALAADPQNMLAVAGLGHLRLTSGDLNGAIPFYERAVHNLPLPALVVTLGELYDQAGRPADAQKQYALVGAIESLWQANGGNVDLDLALFEADHGDPSKAVTFARAELARRDSVQVDDALAWALYRSGDVSAARAASQKALRLGSKDPVLLFHAGMIEARLGNRDGARTLLNQALQIDPGFSAHYATLARQTLKDLGASQ